MKEFNLEEFKKNPSQKVVTRDGRDVRIICTDMKSEYPLIALVVTKEEKEEKEIAYCFTEKGNQYSPIERKPELDLFFAPIKREGWVNIYKSHRCSPRERIAGDVFTSEKEAKKSQTYGYITTIKIEWEEE